MMDTGKTAGLVRFSRARKEENLLRLYEAAARVLEERGYLAVSVDDIARAGGVSRQTFYRHFDSKYAIALELFERSLDGARAVWRTLGSHVGEGRSGIQLWVQDVLDQNASNGGMMRAFLEMGMAEPLFFQRVQQLVPDFLSLLIEHSPAVALFWKTRERRDEAALRIGQLLDLCNAHATGLLPIAPSQAVAIIAGDFHKILH